MLLMIYALTSFQHESLMMTEWCVMFPRLVSSIKYQPVEI